MYVLSRNTICLAPKNLQLSYWGSEAMKRTRLIWVTHRSWELLCNNYTFQYLANNSSTKGLRSPFSVWTRQMKLPFYPRVSEWQVRGMFVCYYKTKLHLPDCGIFCSLSTNGSLCKIRIFILIYNVALNGCLFKHPSIRGSPCHMVTITQPSAHRRGLGTHGQRPERRPFAAATSFLIHSYCPSLIMSFEWVLVMQKIDGKSGKKLAQVSQQGHEVEGERTEPN